MHPHQTWEHTVDGTRVDGTGSLEDGTGSVEVEANKSPPH